MLCLTEITSWEILYYAFPVLSPAITADTGWSTSPIVAAFSMSQLIVAMVGVPVGRILDRYGPRWVMTAGSVIAAPALLVIATSQNLFVFYLGWIVAGGRDGRSPLPTRLRSVEPGGGGTDRVRALMILTLGAGLASTVFALLAAFLSDQSDWRRTYLALAAALFVVTVPGHMLGLRGRWPSVVVPHPDAPAAMDRTDVVRTRPFIVLTMSLSLAAFVAFAGVFNLVLLLLEYGTDSVLAVTALGLRGLGRVGYPPLQRVTGVRGRTVGIIGETALTTYVGLTVEETAQVHRIRSTGA